MRHKLAVRVFLMICALLTLCVVMTWWGILTFAPYVYRHSADEMQELTDGFSWYLDQADLHDLPYYVQEHADAVREASQNEFRLHIFNDRGEELSIPDLSPTQGRIEEYSTLEHTALYTSKPTSGQPVFLCFAAQNPDLQSQVAEALRKTFPGIAAAVLAASAAMAAFCSVRLSAPIRSLSAVSERLAGLDFSAHAAMRRKDEIGVLASNLNRLSAALQGALSELQSANIVLQSDIERERQFERRRTAFMAAASHELKTPLTVIRGQLEGMLAQIGRYRDRDRYLAKSLAETDRLRAMVDDLLLLARLGSSVQPASEDMALKELIEQCATDLEDLWDRRALRLKLDLDDLHLSGDAGLLRKAAGNLLLNAALYATHGSTVNVLLKQQDGAVHLSVENDCPAFHGHDLERLFDPLFRPDPARSRKTGGSGLGLFIVRSIARLHSGTAEAENTERGLRVTIRFPAAGLTRHTD